MGESLWQGTAGETTFSQLSGRIETDVVIVGGGITGITAALLLARGGKEVVVLEARRVGSGTTGASTGNLHILPDQSLSGIRDKWGVQTAAEVAESRREALALVETTIAEFDLDCAFSRRPHYLLATAETQLASLQAEQRAATDAGLEVSLLAEPPLPMAVRQALRIEDQAQFHPLRFVQGLAQAIASPHCRIFEHSPVLSIDGARRTVSTASGQVQAAAILMATHTPKGVNILQTELGPYREYAIAGRLADEFPPGIFWTMEEPSHSLRQVEHDGARYLLVIGEKHKTGQHDTLIDYFARLEEFFRQRFRLEGIDYRWSAQNYRPADGLPYIGPSVAWDGLFVACGFGTNGLLYGPLAAMIVSDEILGRTNRHARLYRAKRLEPTRAAGTFARENVNVAKQYLRDYLTAREKEALSEIPPGEGRVAVVDGERLAVYRDEAGNWSSVSPVCTHLGCINHWNRLEQSWDCPCHGSRFRPDGEVIEGPALTPLARKELRADRVGGGVAPAVLPHHRAYGSVHGGSQSMLKAPEPVD